VRESSVGNIDVCAPALLKFKFKFASLGKVASSSITGSSRKLADTSGHTVSSGGVTRGMNCRYAGTHSIGDTISAFAPLTSN
jgi:hypothetical protein